jgi:hypothetical protein
MKNVIAKVEPSLVREPLKHVPRGTPSADGPMVIFFGGLKDIDFVASLLEHVAKITSGDSGASYCKVHLNRIVLGSLIFLQDYAYTCLLSDSECTCHQVSTSVDADLLF